MSAHEVVLEVRTLRKAYGGLRPLRLEHLVLRQGESIAITGLDEPAAQVLVDLLTGATAPDDGDVIAFGQQTGAIADGDAWFALLDRVGILSARAVLLDALTVEQNLALPFSLQLNPVPPDVSVQVSALAMDVGLRPADLSQQAGAAPPAVRLRVRLARAVALAPRLLLCEHPNALAPQEDLSGFADDLRALVAGRGLASLTLTADPVYAASVATRVLTLDPATGALRERTSTGGGWRGLLDGWRR